MNYYSQEPTNIINIPHPQDQQQQHMETGLSYSPSFPLDSETSLWKQMTSSSGLPRETHFKNEGRNFFFPQERRQPAEYSLTVVPTNDQNSTPNNDFEFEQDKDAEMETINFSNSPYQSVHYQACRPLTQNNELSASTVNSVDSNGNTPLMWAVNCNNLEMISALVSNNANVNQQNNEGETALYLACARGYSECVSYLCEHGASFNIVNIEGASCAHIAAAHGHVRVLEYLIYLGCFMNLQDEFGDTPLHWAVRENKPDCVRTLVESAKVPISTMNEDGETPKQLASDLGETLIEQYLMNIEHSASIESQFQKSLHF
eukprot:TRINITY_DN71520_c0_g1_i1.p1 TRINITY_DN71520_c0_g1~~TRINITY_DN71520_c0_g1_i1.p1  ORF type:complete len:317 (-),score=36.95 TRINITY_DN71520_c0_g1_i1:82-1032(-)